LAFWLDRSSCARADRVLLDTQAHADYFQHTFNVPGIKLGSLFVGCDEGIFYPRQRLSTTPLVLYYGSFLPLQGIDVIVRAAKLLERRSNVHFRIIGAGIESTRIHALVNELDVRNVSFLPPVPLEQLPEHIQEASICLGGHFGTSAKASRVIAGKTFQCIAMGKPTIVGDNSANRELLRHGQDAWFCKMNDPQALAEAILHLISDPELCVRLGDNAHRTFMKRASIQALSGQLKQIVDSMIG
jgi:glycosyltransferase involved in cell wall biosynthesis